MNSNDTSDPHAKWRVLSWFCLGAAVVYLITAFILSLSTGTPIRESVPATGGIVGPLTTDDAGTVVEVEVNHRLPLDTWSFITGEVLDANKEYLIGFGDEMWHEAGYSSDGRWEESVTNYEANVTLREPGTYYFKFNVESNKPLENLRSLYVTVEKQIASSIPHFVGGILLLIVGVLMNFLNGGGLSRLMDEALD